MPHIRINFADVSEGLGAIPKGEYPVVVKEAKLATGQASGKPYIFWRLAITEGEYANRQLFLRTSLSENALWRLKSIFRNLGLDVDQALNLIADDETGYIVSPQLVDLTAIAVVGSEEYDGRETNVVLDLLPLPTKSRNLFK